MTLTLLESGDDRVDCEHRQRVLAATVRRLCRDADLRGLRTSATIRCSLYNLFYYFLSFLYFKNI